ncbi:phage portal protein [Caballeronia sp. LZ043]|uniref:phage portal protein n=1 Tax=Caballeronia sp. LZ043 TaxID=3038569 RepID=UPI0028563BFA|nr:phage portal protein [Caballeronia sp. LZ043]MDR5825799.1 phage portal protein [Caballeronia sp. LZ043]
MAGSKKPGRVKSAIINWLGVPIGLLDGTFWQEFFSSATASGKNVSVDSAMQLSAVFACVRLLSETVSTLPLKVYRKQADGSRAFATDHPLYRLLSQSPNAEMTPGRFMLFIVASICLRGNAFVEKFIVAGRIIALNPLLPQNMDVKRLDNGQLQYTYTDQSGKRVIPVKNMMHIRGFGLDGVCGMHPIATGKELFGSAMAAEEAAARIFAQGMQASGFLSSEATLKPEQREQIRKSLNSFMGSQNAGKLMVLEAGLKYEGITMNPEAAQMLQTRAMNVELICSWFKVPPFMIGHMDKQSSWAASVEAQNLHFLTNSLRPLLDNIEQEITRCLIDPVDRDTIYAEFSVEALLRADSAGRAAFYNVALQNGWMSRNEVRRMENLPPIPGGDVYTVQTNLTPIEQLGKGDSPANAARAAVSAWLSTLDQNPGADLDDREAVRRAQAAHRAEIEALTS